MAIDLPGVGESGGAATDGSKRQLAAVVRELISTLGLREVTLVGQDVGDNREAAAGPPASTPLLYLRGQHESGNIDTYVRGLRAAGVPHVEQAVIPDAGHFTQEEAPEQTWHAIARFAGL